MSNSPERALIPLPSGAKADGAGPDPQSPADAGFAAQALGQGGQKRGLKGGAPVLSAARQSYLHTQWSGPGDRRTRAGVIRRDEV